MSPAFPWQGAPLANSWMVSYAVFGPLIPVLKGWRLGNSKGVRKAGVSRAADKGLLKKSGEVIAGEFGRVGVTDFRVKTSLYGLANDI